ncbi:hypothetical protein ACVIGA_007590 [Bradyrhizobium sp. USDA 3240]
MGQEMLLFDAYKGISGRSAKARDIPRTRNAYATSGFPMHRSINCVHIPMQCESPIPNCWVGWLMSEYGEKII